ncbi:hypothetical protein AQUSIP_07580 [Aquicella siphonis]|uniref:Uncharacterized protein n=1 Tax=Aquicella siphonis TaxID=254247 RepID=A0A5E4PG31_9COXI|nr:hypothetical protein [Aquicella siphonis]VVC75468.1 hypothetical protein AQUSIP_07580 [Aquicella siphonis]
MKNKLKRLLTVSSWAMLLCSHAAISAPSVLFKDISNTGHSYKAGKPPQAVNDVIRDIQSNKPDSYKIIVYKNENHYLLYTLSGKTWDAEKIRVDLDASGKMISLIPHYQGGLKELTSKTNSNPVDADKPGVCPDSNIQFLAISAYPGVAAVNESIEIVSEAAKKKYKTMTIVDENADGQTYKNWLSCPNLKGVYSVGHGAPDEMIVGKGDVLSYGFFNQPEMMNNFKNTTVVINACEVYNYPIGTNIMYGNAMLASDFLRNPGPNTYEYMGGHTDLLMYSSEKSSACFMAKAIEGAKMDYDTLKQCISDQDIHFQNFGLSNPGRYFDRPAS